MTDQSRGVDTGRSRNRAAIGLGVAAIASTVFALLREAPSSVSFVEVGVPAAIVLVACGIAATLGGVLGRRSLAIIAGAALVGAALLQLVQLNTAANLLGGDASTMALLGGFGVGLLACGLLTGRPRD